MNHIQRQMIKEAYQEGYNEAAQLSEEELEEHRKQQQDERHNQ